MWNRPVADLSALAISPQGQRIAMLANNGKIAVWSAANGSPLWSHDKETARDIAVTDGIGYVLAYDSLNPLDTKLSILSGGNVVWKQPLDGAIWAAAVTSDGSHAAISTDKHSIYYCTLDPQPRWETWRADGIPESLDFAPNDDFLVAGLWNSSGVECFGMDGKQVWEVSGPSDRRYEAFVTPQSRYIVAISYGNHKASDGTVTLLGASDGHSLWSYPLGQNSYYITVLSTADAQSTVASFTRLARHGHALDELHRMIALDRSGARIWDKGGLFFSPTLVCMAPDSEGVVVYDGSRTLYLLDNQGHIVNHAQVSGQLRLWAVTADDRQLLIYTGDGQLSCYRLG